MRQGVAICIAALLYSTGLCQTAKTIVASSGAPSLVLDARSGRPDPSNPIVTKLGMDSGKVPGMDERWTAYQFVLSAPTSFDAIEVFFFERQAQVPTRFGWKVYADAQGQPGAVLAEGSGSYGALLARSAPKMFENSFEVDWAGSILFPTELSLPAGKYWATVYGTDGNLPQYVGSPGGSPHNFAWRKTTTGSPYTRFETKLYCMPSYVWDLAAGYDRMGPAPPYDYSGWAATEQQGRDIYHICFALVDTSGFAGTVVNGRLVVPHWPEPPVYTIPGFHTDPQAFDILFLDPATSLPQIVETVSLDSTGRFTTQKVRNGTYEIRVYPRHWLLGRFTCFDGYIVHQQPYVAGMGHPYLPTRVGTVTLTGGTKDLGDIVLWNGDVNLDGEIGIQDLNTAVLNIGEAIYGGCPPPWDGYVLTRDCNGDGVLGVQDLATVLVHFAKTGPTR